MPNAFMTTLAGKTGQLPPVWLMRQAGRYLPEYREVRNSEPDFISFCLNPSKAVEVTLQPIRKFDFDAAIIFSDILMVPWAMNRNVRFIPGTGPVLDALQTIDDIDSASLGHLPDRLKPVAKAISLCRGQLHEDKALIGFAGAPWTVITYMLEGGSSRDFATARGWIWQNDGQFDALLDLVTEATVEFLAMQAAAGADVLMLFDSWASAVPAEFRQQGRDRPGEQDHRPAREGAASRRQSSGFRRASAKGLSPIVMKPISPVSGLIMESIRSGPQPICHHM